MEKHVAIYVRVSGRSQDTASQEPDLRRWAASRDAATSLKWYRDQLTGKTRDRPGWNRLVKAVQEGKVSVVVVWRLDRLGRTAKGLAELFQDLRQRQVNLVSLKDGIDLAKPSGRLIAHVLASVAQSETEVRAERIVAGQAMARAKGVRFGRPEGTGKRIKVTPEQEATIRRLKAEGTKVAAIARAVGLSRPTIYSVLDRTTC
ncbi:MAG: recombinase family protein [Acidimicrobiia bacterium]|nr:recombinase family protein [Acidimicrobiia bacterium]